MNVLWYNRVMFLEMCSVLTVGEVKGCWKSVVVIVGVDCGVECGRAVGAGPAGAAAAGPKFGAPTKKKWLQQIVFQQI